MDSEKHMSNLRDKLSNSMMLKDKYNYSQTLLMITYAHHLEKKKYIFYYYIYFLLLYKYIFSLKTIIKLL